VVFTFSDRALHISHNLPVLVVEELHPYLGHLASRTRAADDLHNDSEFNRIHVNVSAATMLVS